MECTTKYSRYGSKLECLQIAKQHGAELASGASANVYAWKRHQTDDRKWLAQIYQWWNPPGQEETTWLGDAEWLEIGVPALDAEPIDKVIAREQEKN